MREFLIVSRAAFLKPLCMSYFLRTDRMCPRITKAKLRGGFLGDDFVGGFYDRAKWITHYASIFPVGVVNTPQLAVRLQSRGPAHVSSSP